MIFIAAQIWTETTAEHIILWKMVSSKSMHLVQKKKTTHTWHMIDIDVEINGVLQ